MISRLLSICVCGFVLFSQTAHADFVSMRVGETGVLLTEQTNPGQNTFSGSHQHRLTTTKLFSAFQFVSTAEDGPVNVNTLQAAPIFVPQAEVDTDAKFCIELDSINGFYTAFNKGTPITKGTEETFKLSVSTSGDEPVNIKDYTEDLMLMRGFLASDCTARGTNYYIPLWMTETPTTFLAVFEVGNAGIEVELLGLKGEFENEVPLKVDFDCQPTIRLNTGYDCRLPLDTLHAAKNGQDFDLFKVRLVVKRPGSQDDVFDAIVSIPSFHAG